MYYKYLQHLLILLALLISGQNTLFALTAGCEICVESQGWTWTHEDHSLSPRCWPRWQLHLHPYLSRKPASRSWQPIVHTLRTAATGTQWRTKLWCGRSCWPGWWCACEDDFRREFEHSRCKQTRSAIMPTSDCRGVYRLKRSKRRILHGHQVGRFGPGVWSHVPLEGSSNELVARMLEPHSSRRFIVGDCEDRHNTGFKSVNSAKQYLPEVEPLKHCFQRRLGSTPATF